MKDNWRFFCNSDHENDNIELVKYRQKNESYERNISENCYDLNHEEYDMNLYYYLLNVKITDSLGKTDN